MHSICLNLQNVLFLTLNTVNNFQLSVVVAFEFTYVASRMISSLADSVNKVGPVCSRIT